MALVRRFADGLSYAEAGAPGARPIVFLHGIGGSAECFAPQLASFGRDYRAIAWDMPGYGASRPMRETTIAGFAADFLDLADALGLSKPILVGHSLGGMIVQDVLAARPDFAGAAILVGTSPAFGPADGEWQKAFVAARLGPLDRGATMAELAPGIVDGMLGPAPDPAGRATAIRAMAALSPASYRASVLSLQGFDNRANLAAIRVPTLLLVGSQDGNAPPAMVERMAAKIPGAAFVRLEGLGHLPNLERPDAFDGAIHAFLDARDLAAAGGTA